MDKLKEFYFYNEIIMDFKKNMKINSEILNNDVINDYIKNKLDEGIKQKIKLNQNNYQNDFFDNHSIMDEAKFDNLNNNKQIIKFPYKFYILNEKTYLKIIKRKNTIIQFKDKDYLINNGKLFIRCEYIFSGLLVYEIIVGKINSINNKFIPELLFYYDSIKQLDYHYNLLKNQKYEEQYNTRNKSENNFLTIHIKKGNQYHYNIGRIFDISESKKNFDKKLDFLLNLYFQEVNLKNRINKFLVNYQRTECGYIIKEDIIKMHKNLFNYDFIKKILQNEKYKAIINKYQIFNSYNI